MPQMAFAKKQPRTAGGSAAAAVPSCVGRGAGVMGAGKKYWSAAFAGQGRPENAPGLWIIYAARAMASAARPPPGTVTAPPGQTEAPIYAYDAYGPGRNTCALSL